VRDILGGLVLIALAGVFAQFSYYPLKARLTGRPNAFAPKRGNRRPGRLGTPLYFAALALLCAGGAIMAFGHLAGLVDYESADE
jgi:hypothetical protein